MELMNLAQRHVGTEPAHHVPAEIPRAGMVVAIILSMLTISVLAVCFMRRLQAVTNWSKVPLTRLLILLIYFDSMLFIFITAILEFGFGLNTSMSICGTAILLCIACYMSTKLIYYFLVEKVYIIRSVSTPRLKSKLYLFNCFGMLLPYAVVVILNFVWRTAYFNSDGMCIIGMEQRAMMPLIIFDALVNLYLTILFVLPLRRLYSYKQSTNNALRTITIRSFIGSLATLTSSVVNLTILMVLKGEAAWICLMCCNADTLFSVLVLHWVTSKDSQGGTTNASKSGGVVGSSARKGATHASTLESSNANPFNARFGTFDDEITDGGITTYISANDGGKGRDVHVEVKEADDCEDVEKKTSRSRKGSNKSTVPQSYPLNRIQVGRIVETVSEPRTGPLGLVNLDGMKETVEMSRGDSQGSMEDLVRKESRV